MDGGLGHRTKRKHRLEGLLNGPVASETGFVPAESSQSLPPGKEQWQTLRSIAALQVPRHNVRSDRY